MRVYLAEHSTTKPRSFHSRRDVTTDEGPFLSPTISTPAASLESPMQHLSSSLYGAADYATSFTAKKKMRERVQQNLLSRPARQSAGSPGVPPSQVRSADKTYGATRVILRDAASVVTMSGGLVGRVASWFT